MANNNTNQSPASRKRRERDGSKQPRSNVSATRQTSGRQVRLRPVHREQIDASTIALCYWLVAARIVEEAEKHGDLDCPDPEFHGSGDGELK